jgi:phosphohistidine phosphatase SixA
MALVFLVRHAQASFGTHDYDRLSELGRQQSRWLGEYFAERGVRFARVVAGA